MPCRAFLKERLFPHLRSDTPDACQAGHVASGGGPAGPPQQRSSLKLSRAASSNLSTSDEPQALLSRSAESLHGASAAVRRAKQEVGG